MTSESETIEGWTVVETLPNGQVTFVNIQRNASLQDCRYVAAQMRAAGNGNVRVVQFRAMVEVIGEDEHV